MIAPAIVVRLVTARRAAGLSQAELGRRLGVTQTAISYWESGRREMGLVTACAYADAVGLALTVGARG